MGHYTGKADDRFRTGRGMVDIVKIPLGDYQSHLRIGKFADALADTREEYQNKRWQIVPHLLRKVDTGSGTETLEVIEYLAISTDP